MGKNATAASAKCVPLTRQINRALLAHTLKKVMTIIQGGDIESKVKKHKRVLDLSRRAFVVSV